MPKPKKLSGGDVEKIFLSFGFTTTGQRGSHIKMVRTVSSQKQVLVISNNKELKTGAVVGNFKQALAYIPENELRPFFYTK